MYCSDRLTNVSISVETTYWEPLTLPSCPSQPSLTPCLLELFQRRRLFRKGLSILLVEIMLGRSMDINCLDICHLIVLLKSSCL